MRINSYTPEQIEFLREGYRRMHTRDLTEAFNREFGQVRTHYAIRSALRNYNIKCGRAHKDRLMKRLRLYTEEQIQYLRDNYRDISVADMTEQFNAEFGTDFTVRQINTALKNRRICSGRNGQWKKGHQSWNKGKKGYMGPNRTSFKKGNRPHNTKHLWYERESKDGYIEISVPETNPHTGYHRRFKAKQVWLWEQKHGPVPEGHVVAFADGDPANFEPENLILLNRLELLRLNKLQHKEAPEEIQPVLITLAKLEARAIRAKKR